ncbi:c-type cytochrome [Desulfobacca acetoxidans]|uniref:Cytochrome c domain-containing protein n=1 Tax=Desulfobacca acetoxidans (strain ATCC 700848 / DSM 11109 / ASRB2) TaxID=880072 RepID=F2NGG8_DESAR|nr:c-type cytochrome [Desulfobacca acetoxidans]AEB08581.1 hypothetical protein Desac_0701 [Desulfobacca acetoxidans DSM 11109]
MKIRRLWLTLANAVFCLSLAGCQETPPVPREPQTTIQKGLELSQRLSCWGCHQHQGQGADLGPNLDGVGNRLARAELEGQLQTPRGRHPDSRMPSFAFIRPFEQKALVDYLLTLQ